MKCNPSEWKQKNRLTAAILVHWKVGMWFFPWSYWLVMPTIQSEWIKYEKSGLTFFNKSGSSVLAFFSYPGGGNAKQRDIAQNAGIQKANIFDKQKSLNYFPVALFQERNEPVTMLLSMHHVPTFISSFNNPP